MFKRYMKRCRCKHPLWKHKPPYLTPNLRGTGITTASGHCTVVTKTDDGRKVCPCGEHTPV